MKIIILMCMSAIACGEDVGIYGRWTYDADGSLEINRPIYRVRKPGLTKGESLKNENHKYAFEISRHEIKWTIGESVYDYKIENFISIDGVEYHFYGKGVDGNGTAMVKIFSFSQLGNKIVHHKLDSGDYPCVYKRSAQQVDAPEPAAPAR